jgi:predicted anti-sigma-YlaC factor YlaD
MRNPKTTILGVLTVIIALATGAKEYLETESLAHLPMVVMAILAGLGLVEAKDHDARL